MSAGRRSLAPEDDGKPGRSQRDLVWPTLSITPIGPPDLRCRAASPSRGRLAQQILPRTKEPRFSQAVSLGGRERGVSLPPFHPMSCLLPRRPGIPNLSWATLQCPGGTFPQNPWGDCCTGSTGRGSELSSRPLSLHPPGMFNISQMKNRPMILIGG